MARIALYARVSTGDQNTASQLDALRAYSVSRGFPVAGEYVDVISGSRDRRPELDRLLADSRRRAVDAVGVVKLDRLARSVRHLVEMANEFERLGVDLIVLDQGIDTTTASGRSLFHTLAAVAEFERDLIRDRTRAGLAAARRRGRLPDRPRATRPPGLLARVRCLNDSGRSLAEIGAVLDVSKSMAAKLVHEARER